MPRRKPSEFAIELARNIDATILKEKKAGTVSMSMDNLLQITPIPAATDGPYAGNMQWQYRQLFQAAIELSATRRKFTGVSDPHKREV